MKITKEMLKAKIEFLNAISKATYGLHWAYGKVKLIKIEEKGGISAVSDFGTKNEIACIINAIERYTYFERMEK